MYKNVRMCKIMNYIYDYLVHVQGFTVIKKN